MWVAFALRGKEETVRKFNISSTDMSTTRETKEGIWDKIDPLKDPRRRLAGIAVLQVDSKTGVPHWATFDGDGKDFKQYPPSHPLLFPAEIQRLPIGTRVELHLPEEEEPNEPR